MFVPSNEAASPRPVFPKLPDRRRFPGEVLRNGEAKATKQAMNLNFYPNH